ncbi:MAG: pentapeptide repeat-containing protein [Phycisphaerales bacterium]
MDKNAALRVGARAGFWSSLLGRTTVAAPIAGGGLLSIYFLGAQTTLMRKQNELIEAQNKYFQQQIAQTDRRAAASEELSRLANRQTLLETLHDPAARPGVRAHAVRAMAVATMPESPIDLLGSALGSTSLSGVDLSRAQLRGCDLRDASWSGVALGLDLSDVRLAGARFDACDWSAARGRDIELAAVTFPHDVFEESLLDYDKVVLTADGFLLAESDDQVQPGTHSSRSSIRERWPMPRAGDLYKGRSGSRSIERDISSTERTISELGTLDMLSAAARIRYRAQQAGHLDGEDLLGDQVASQEHFAPLPAYFQAYMMLEDVLASFAREPYLIRYSEQATASALPGSERYFCELPEWPGVRFAIADLRGPVGSLPRWGGIRWEMSKVEAGVQWRLLADISEDLP